MKAIDVFEGNREKSLVIILDVCYGKAIFKYREVNILFSSR